MAETNLLSSKIVATPTPTAWSQAYSAGRLFAALSLQTELIHENGGEKLNSLGKDLISTLESEFFTLENKDLESIKQAVNTTVARIGEGVNLSLIICYLSENVLYLFATGGSKAILKRGDKIGTVLQGEENIEVKSASGYVQEGDIIVLETKSFQRIISPASLASSLDSDNPEEITEALAPQVHEKSEGGASSVVLVYKKNGISEVSQAPITNVKADEEPEKIEEEIKENDETIPVVDLDEKETNEAEASDTEASTEPTRTIPETQTIDLTSESEETQAQRTRLPSETAFSPTYLDELPSKRKRVRINLNLSFFKKFPLGIPKKLSHSRKIILTVAIALVVIIALTSFLALRNQGSSSNKELFAKVFEEAKTKYDEGQNLKDLNASLAKESFQEAKNILVSNKDKFKESSEEGRQISNLLASVDEELSKANIGEEAQVKEVEKSSSDILSYEMNNSNANYFTQNKDNVYFLDGSGVSRISKNDDKKSEIIKKDWDEDGGIGLFGSNIYILDKKSGVLKFVPSGSTYSKSDYFKDEAPKLTDSQAMAIDGSIYILYSDGKIDKYTKGAKDTFDITGLEKPLSSPTKIFTNEDIDNIYVIDNGNSRLVVLDKSGKFVKAYTASIMKDAKDIDVDESGKKVFILSGSKIYQLDLK